MWVSVCVCLCVCVRRHVSVVEEGSIVMRSNAIVRNQITEFGTPGPVGIRSSPDPVTLQCH